MSYLCFRSSYSLMTEPETAVGGDETTRSKPAADPEWNGLYKAGAIILVVFSFVGFFLFLMSLDKTSWALGTSNDPAAQLQLVARHLPFYTLGTSLWLIDDLVTILPVLAVYLVLRPVSRTGALAGAVFSLAYAVFDVCVTEMNSLTLNELAYSYGNAATPALQNTYVTAAAYGLSAIPAQTVMTFGIGAVGYLIYSIVMWKSFFGKATAALGIVANVVGIFGAAASVAPSSGAFVVLGLLELATVPLTAVWTLVVGIKLYHFSRRNGAPTLAPEH